MTLEEVKRQRSNTRKSITRINNQIEASGRGEGKILSAAKLKCYFGSLQSSFKQMLTYQTQKENNDPEDNSRVKIEGLHITAEISIQSQLVHKATIADSTICYCVINRKLAQLKLPTLFGKYNDYFLNCL